MCESWTVYFEVSNGSKKEKNEFRKYSKLNENKDIIVQNLWYTSKAVLSIL